MTLSSGSTIGTYQILELLGAGNFRLSTRAFFGVRAAYVEPVGVGDVLAGYAADQRSAHHDAAGTHVSGSLGWQVRAIAPGHRNGRASRAGGRIGQRSTATGPN